MGLNLFAIIGVIRRLISLLCFRVLSRVWRANSPKGGLTFRPTPSAGTSEDGLTVRPTRWRLSREVETPTATLSGCRGACGRGRGCG